MKKLDSLVHRYPWYAPRFWNGMRARTYWRLLAGNRFQVHPARWPMMTLVGGCALFNSTWGLLQDAFYRRVIEAQTVQPPIFVIGHWRTGTTLLHELLALDSRFAFPANYDCFVPSHFLVTHRFLSPLLRVFLPRQRPMDDMALSPGQPQEDEFAVLALGGPTPYRRIGFPNRGPVDQGMLDFDTAPPEQVERFRQVLVHFFQALTYRYGAQPLLLKSPPHTGRIRKLSEWFPGARFIHIAREPVRVARSTLKLWATLDAVQGFQLARYTPAELEEFVFDSQRRMYAGYFAQRPAIDPRRLAEVRFEDLLQAPSETLEKIYEQFGWGAFDAQRPKIAQYFVERQQHRVDQRAADLEFAGRVRVHWSAYSEAFGYGERTRSE